MMKFCQNYLVSRILNDKVLQFYLFLNKLFILLVKKISINLGIHKFFLKDVLSKFLLNLNLI